MVLIVPPLPKGTLLSQNSEDAESRRTIRQRVIKAYNIQLARQGKSNDKLTPDEVEKLVPLTKENKQLLSSVIDKLALSAHGYHRILKVARTIADLTRDEKVGKPHLIEAI
jgi:magnesium chelatase family protein